MLKKKIIAVSIALIFLRYIGCAEEAGFIPAVSAKVKMTDQVAMGGMPFGVKFFAKGIVVVGFTEIETADGEKTPAYDAGLRVNDVITHVNGREVKNSEEMIRVIESAEDAVEIRFVRSGEENTVTFVPSVSSDDGRKKTGMWIRDTTAGIGTVTFICPETGEFAGLGHGICDSETGELLKMERGSVVDVKITGVEKGIAGTPGELKGYFTSEKSGVLLKNTDCGVYGVLACPKCEKEEIMELGDRYSVTEGEATIRCTLDEGQPREYRISISEIDRDSRDNRSFSITVIDEALLAQTGGIIQGMSGSPIFQNGKIVGAVTHVLINDPAKGYGIFIENMLEAAE